MSVLAVISFPEARPCSAVDLWQHERHQDLGVFRARRGQGGDRKDSIRSQQATSRWIIMQDGVEAKGMRGLA